MSDLYLKEVRFDIWCPLCIYHDVDDTKGEEPCNTCLVECARKNTTKPIKLKTKTGSAAAKG